MMIALTLQVYLAIRVDVLMSSGLGLIIRLKMKSSIFRAFFCVLKLFFPKT